jgi:hypothetical protein
MLIAAIRPCIHAPDPGLARGWNFCLTEGCHKEGIMNVEECKELVESYHDATNRGDLDALDKIFAKDFINEAAGFDPVRGSEDMKKGVGQRKEIELTKNI